MFTINRSGNLDLGSISEYAGEGSTGPVNWDNLEVKLFELMEGLSQSELRKFMDRLKSDGRVPKSTIDNLQKKLGGRQSGESGAQVPAGYRAGSSEASSRKAEMGVGAVSQQVALNNKLAAKIA